MRFRSYYLLLLICLTSSIYGQPVITTDITNGPWPWTSLSVNDNADQFQFLIVTDRTGGHRPGVFEDAVQKINLLQPEFVMSVGDLIEGYTEDTSILAAEWAEFNGFIDQLTMPFFYVPGNHDLTNAVMEKIYLEQFGRTYYHFIYKDVLFLCLNSEDQLRGAGRGTISQPQYTYIDSVLAAHPNVRHTFAFLHQPLWTQDDPKYWPQVEELLSGRPHTVFAGHYHHYVKRSRNDGKYIMLATTGGGSQLRGPQFGEFDHVVWVTMTAQGPVIANLLLQGIWDENVATEETESYIEQLLAQQVVQIEAQFQSDTLFEESDFAIKITNKQEIPLTVRIEEGFGWDVWVTVDSHEVVLPPNSVREVAGHFQSRGGGHIKDFRPTPLKFFVTATLAEHGSLEVPVGFNLKPLYKPVLSKTTSPVSIDGNLSEWNRWTDRFGTTTDNEVAYGVSYDDAYLYLAAQVKDDTIQIDTSQSFWRQDCIGVQLSLLAATKSAINPADKRLIRVTPAANGLPSRVYRPESIPEDWDIACKANAGGYVLEIRIPVSYLEESQGGDWNSVRLNWYVDDMDHPSDWQSIERSWFVPEWGSREEVLGSGTFFKRP